MKIAIFSGNEKWILRGLAIDIEKALRRLGNDVARYEVELSKPTIKPPKADWYLFVQQGQLHSIMSSWNFREDLVKKSICIFTHFDYKNCQFKLLNSIYLVSHMSSHQMSIAIGNGLSKKNSKLLILGVDEDRHFPARQKDISIYLNKNYREIVNTDKRSYIGFCTRLWSKSTYTKRKNYECLFEVINRLVSSNQKVLVIGDGWEKAKIKKNENIVIVDPPYKDYNCFYNLMKCFVSVTSYDGGPIPLLETMACGVPPIVTNSGFAPDIITDNNYGELFQPFSEPDTVIELIEKSNKVEYTRRKLRERACEYSFIKYAKNLTKILSSSKE
jgi:glycosyltransferase involved in cell wall biosynthesis